jgi:lysozyme family protein
MGDIKKVNFDYIRRWEGGLSKDKRDPAAKVPVPDGSGYHTNIGITWQAFAANAPLLNYKATPALFYEMPKDIWLSIYQGGYWASVKGDFIKSQAISELIADWAWGSGPGTATLYVQSFLKKQGLPQPVTGYFGPVTLGILNDYIKTVGEKVAFEGIYQARVKFLKSLSNWKTYGIGWMNRMNDFYAYGQSILK